MTKEMMDMITSIQNKNKDTKQEYNRIINDTKKQLDQLISKVTDEDIKELINKNYNPEKMTIDILSKTVSNNKTAFKNDDTKKIEQEVNKQLEHYAKIFGNKEEIKSIINKLKEKNMPVNEHNIMRLRSALNKYEAIKDLKDESILNVLKNNIDTTVGKVYEAKYSSVQSNTKSLSNNEDQQVLTDKELDQLEPQMKELFKNNGIEDNEENIDIGKKLIKNNIDINKSNINKYLFLKDIENNTNSDEIITKAIDNIITDNKIDDIELTDQEISQSDKNQDQESITNNNNINNDKSKEAIKIKSIIDNIPKVRDQHLKKIIQEKKSVNLDNLIQESRNITNNEEVNLQSINEQNQYITAKRQLEEIRLKMTVESAGKLINNGFKIDTAPLNKIVEELKKVEEQSIRIELESVGAKVTDSNVSKMSEVIETVANAKEKSSNILGLVMQKKVDYTLKTIANSNNNVKNNNQSIESYDKLGTKPRADLGDSISKTYNQIDNILEDMGIEVNPKNIRAAKILAYNEMEISESNINGIKLIDQQVSIVLNRLHPNIVANMIKDNLSPIDMNIDEVINYMNDFDEFIGEDLTDKIAMYINQMDKDNALTEEERNSMIGIYRMLNTISKSEGRAVGFLMKKDMKLSLNNLLEASKYLRKTGGKHTDINVNIDDNFGALEHLKYDGESIKKQIQQAFEKAGFEVNKNINLIESIEEFELEITKDNIIDMKYMENNIKEFIRKSSPNNIKHLLEKEGIMNKDIDDILYFMEDENIVEDIDTTEIRDYLDRIRNISSKPIEFLQKLQLPINLKNLNTINNLLQDNNELSNRLKHFMNEIDDSNINNEIIGNISNLIDRAANGEEMGSIYRQLINEFEEIKGETYTLESNKRLDITKDLTDITRILDMNKELEDKEGYMQIPVMLNGEITQLNMFFIDKDKINNEQSAKVLVSLKTKNLGTVNSVLEINNKEVNINITSTKDEEIDFLKKYKTQLENILQGMGYDVNHITFDNVEVKTPLESNLNISFDNKSSIDQGNFEMRI